MANAARDGSRGRDPIEDPEIEGDDVAATRRVPTVPGGPPGAEDGGDGHLGDVEPIRRPGASAGVAAGLMQREDVHGGLAGDQI